MMCVLSPICAGAMGNFAEITFLFWYRSSLIVFVGPMVMSIFHDMVFL